MKKITTLRGKMFNGILSLTLILTAGFFNSAQAQIFDGNKCSGEWADADAFVDTDPANVTASADIHRVWFGTKNDSAHFAVTRHGDNGQFSLAMFFDVNCNASDGDATANGAERAIFFNLSRVGGVWVIDDTEIYEYVSSSWSVISGKTFEAYIGDSACTGSKSNFFEFRVALVDFIPNICNIGSCGGVTLTYAESYSGGVFNSTLKDQADINAFTFVNESPVPSITFDDAVCSGTTVTLDGSGSTENSVGNGTSYDDVVSIEWDYNFNGTFSTDHTGSSYTTPTLISNSGITTYPIAVRVTDVFDCTTTYDTLEIDVYANPTVTFAAVTDIDSVGKLACHQFEFTFEGSATDYAGNAFSSLGFRTADGNLGSSSAAGTFGDIAYVYTYGDCRWSSALIGELDKVIAIDPVSGCSDSAVMSPPVPVELISFKGEVIGADAHIKWQTASELNSDYFIVEKSLDGKNYTFVQNVTAAGNSSEILDYMIIDPNMEEGNVYYRLTQYDFNGAYEVFDPIVLNKADGQGRIKVSPNPTSDVVNVNIPASKYNGELVILDLAGKQVFSTNVNANVNSTSVDIDVASLPKGMYYVRFGNEKEGFTSQMLQLL